ncbi:MAG: A/G-specific adenine glycosylase [Gammaproteobacteria bacterium]|nr:A/G-specific adenine glycosylase [Gammaproteobacteria bacterium]
MSNSAHQFTTPLLAWFDLYGRKNLPWQQPKTPYRVYVSEIMLQQTQVKTVIPYFERFMQRFPTLQSLALATEDEVLSYWSGLGYYSRGRNLLRCAQHIMSQYQGEFPEDMAALQQLPGIGPSTAAAIASLAFGRPVAIFDGNVKRVISRYFMTEHQLMEHATSCLSPSRSADYSQAIMDLGALCCRPKQPDCPACPVQATCLAYQHRCVESWPKKNKKKPLPIKSSQFMLIHREHDQMIQVHLEKRPSKGIWGSLWCLPSFPMSESVHTRFPQSELFSTLKHTFTHFHLEMVVYCAPLVGAAEKDMHWFSQIQLSNLGLPKPMSKLLDQFFVRGTS